MTFGLQAVKRSQLLATAIHTIRKTTPLALDTAEHRLRFFGVDTLVKSSGFAVSQTAYGEEQLHLNNMKPTACTGYGPCPRDLLSFDTLLTTEESQPRRSFEQPKS